MVLVRAFVCASMYGKILSHNLIKADWISLQVYTEAIDGPERRKMMVLRKRRSNG